VVGFLNALGMGSVALLQPLTGLFLDLLWDGALQDGVRVYTAADFRQAFLLYPACTAIAFAMCFLARESHNRQLVHA